MKINDVIDGRYKIISLAGKGGTSIVYKAININLGMELAIKEISKSNKEKFDLLVEPNLLKKLQHPSLPRIIDILETKDTFYIIEDFIDGTSLENLIGQVDKFTEKKVLKWGTELAEVLLYLHTQEPNPIIYRDMKPGNIMLNKNGQIKLVDFGIAREFKKEVTTDTVIIGTRGYAAPEQYGTHQTDERTDIYSLGVTMYHLVTGRGPNDPPFEIKSVRTIDQKLSEGIEHIIAKCTKQDPNERYQNINDLIYDFKNIEKLSSKYKKAKRAIRIRGISIIAIFIFFVSLIGVGAYSIRDAKFNEYLEKIEIAVQTEKNMGIEESVESFNNAISMFEKEDEAYLALANAYIGNMQFDNALSLLQKEALEKNKGIQKSDLYSYLLGVCLFAKSDYVSALEEFNKVKDQKIEGFDYYKSISEALSKPEALSGDDEVIKSIDILKKSIEQSNNEDFKIRGYIMLSDIYRDNPFIFENGDEMQIQILEKAISKAKNKNTPILYERLAQAYYSSGLMVFGDEEASKIKFQKSLDNYNLLLKLGYETSTIYKNIGAIYKHLGEYSKSEEVFLRLVQKHPNDFKGYIELAFLYNQIENGKAIENRDYSNVKKYYELAVSVNTNENNMEISRLEVIMDELKSQGFIK